MSKLEWILSGILGLLLITIVGFSLLLSQRPGIGASIAVNDVSGASELMIERNTALLAFSSAQAAALDWHPDARLVEANATWGQEADRQQLSSGKGDWTFTFESPSSEAVAIFSVLDNEARLLTEYASTQQIELLDVTGWQVDSPEAVARMLEEGGDTFMRTAGTTTMTASLTTASQDGRIVWFISLIAMDSGDAFSIRMDATSGETINIEDAR